MVHFKNTGKASSTYSAKLDQESYLERTKRNHYWLGGPEGQMKLQKLKVGVAGLGGMGSNIAEILVRLGVGGIKIADPDIIERSNINRQVIANSSTIGKKKAQASAAELRNIAEDYELVVYDDGITEDNVAEFVSDLDVVVDEIDVFPLQKHSLLHKEARKYDLPLYSGYIIGMGTHIYKFHGEAYTFDDFMLHDHDKIKNPDSTFIMDRYVNPVPSYLEDFSQKKRFQDTIDDQTVAIFGASTYMAQSFLAVRLIVDYLKLEAQWGAPKTPVMPDFLKVDPLSLSLQVCHVGS